MYYWMVVLHPCLTFQSTMIAAAVSSEDTFYEIAIKGSCIYCIDPILKHICSTQLILTHCKNPISKPNNFSCFCNPKDDYFTSCHKTVSGTLSVLCTPETCAKFPCSSASASEAILVPLHSWVQNPHRNPCPRFHHTTIMLLECNCSTQVPCLGSQVHCFNAVLGHLANHATVKAEPRQRY